MFADRSRHQAGFAAGRSVWALAALGGATLGLAAGPAGAQTDANWTGDANELWSYAAGDGNDIQLSTVPEPATAALLGLGAVVLLGRRRRAAVQGRVIQ